MERRIKTYEVKGTCVPKEENTELKRNYFVTVDDDSSASQDSHRKTLEAIGRREDWKEEGR